MIIQSTGGRSGYYCMSGNFFTFLNRYEMIIGIPPFYDKNSNQMFINIESGPIRWPDAAKHGISISKEAQDLISKVIKYFIKPSI